MHYVLEIIIVLVFVLLGITYVRSSLKRLPQRIADVRGSLKRTPNICIIFTIQNIKLYANFQRKLKYINKSLFLYGFHCKTFKNEEFMTE